MKITIDNSDILKITFKGSVNMVQEVTLPKEAIAPIARALKKEGVTEIDTEHFRKEIDTLE
ncbi:MAG: hypothetical protein KAJ20_01400 [Candidatus Aenigmarchaeota archaeon]|nr:hypothetical protein [Candidatus Aenigmarchaeota archaeon]MCK5062352.1 hypothetical protein [Candidatus Aenigmarchaeota archaeon]MCK5290189.1 hypothetical protein [Candidatus Aenigmarchaeota archaeon]MCK5372969.1 hypothetical protein [Candidatus Aenigmarchaeota archaeon]MCK5451973.1 hypothetical protein [Candidatus Aenigmarchaeota archaeon]